MKDLLSIIALAAVLLTAFCRIAAQQDKASPPGEIRDVGQANSKGIDIEAALVDVLLRLQTPGGALLLEECKGAKPTVVLPTTQSRSELMDAIVATDTKYYWRTNGKSINLLPRWFALSPLEIRIKRFQVRNVLVTDAYDQLYALKEAKDGIVGRNLQKPTWRFLAGGVTAEKKRISLDLTNVTLGEALNAIVEADGQKIWLFKVRVCEGRHEYVTGLMN
jgi:hypothetical protein